MFYGGCKSNRACMYKRIYIYTLYSGSRTMFGHVLSVGVPTSLKILFSCSSTSLPGNRGLPLLAISSGRGEFISQMQGT